MGLCPCPAALIVNLNLWQMHLKPHSLLEVCRLLLSDHKDVSPD